MSTDFLWFFGLLVTMGFSLVVSDWRMLWLDQRAIEWRWTKIETRPNPVILLTQLRRRAVHYVHFVSLYKLIPISLQFRVFICLLNLPQGPLLWLTSQENIAIALFQHYNNGYQSTDNRSHPEDRGYPLHDYCGGRTSELTIAGIYLSICSPSTPKSLLTQSSLLRSIIHVINDDCIDQIMPLSTNIGLRLVPSSPADAIAAWHIRCIPVPSHAASIPRDRLLHLRNPRNACDHTGHWWHNTVKNACNFWSSTGDWQSSDVDLVWPSGGAVGISCPSSYFQFPLRSSAPCSRRSLLDDNKNGAIALSGTVAGVLSLSIQLLNITWEVKPFHTQQSHAIFRHECQFSNVINFEILPAIWIHTKIGYGVLRSWGMLHWLHGEEPLLVVFGVIFGIVCIHLNMISILLSKNMERFRLTCFTIPYLTYSVCTVSILFSEQPDFGR